MRKFSLLIALALLITVGGVYAAWVFSESNDVADISGSRSITMTEATFEGAYVTYTINTDGLKMVIDPKTAGSHTTALYVTGEVVITFTASTYAPAEVKSGGVDTKWYLEKDTASWTYNSTSIISVSDTKQDVEWTGSNGTFTCTISADTIAGLLNLTEIVLDDKEAYDAYQKQLGAIDIHVTDGKSASTIVTN